MKKQIKRFLSVSLSAIMLFSALAVAPLTATAAETQVVSTADISGAYEYEMNGDGTVTIRGYIGEKTEVTIPSEIDGKRVSIIGMEAFCWNETLKKVVIPDGVTRIGLYAFADCENLTSITIPDSVTEILYGAFENTAWYNNQPDGVVYAGKAAIGYKGEMPQNTTITIKGGTKSINVSAFADCENLTSITIPDSITSIGENAFNSCLNLASITIPDSVTEIGGSAFRNCTSLANIYVDSKNLSFTAIDGVLFDKEVKTLICYPTGKNSSSYSIPDGVREIGSGAFENCTSLESITIPDSVTSIKSGVLENTAWYDNQPDGVVYAGKVAIGYKGEMPQNTTITVKDGTKSISNYAFYGCENLTSITIPDSVTGIGENAFSDCTSLANIYVDSKNPSYTAIDGVLFDKEVKTLICYPAGKNSSSYSIPDSVTSIKSGVLENTAWYDNQPDGVVYAGKVAIGYKGEMPSNTSVTIKDGTEVICDSAFFNINGLTEIKLPDSLTEVGERAFSFCDNLKSVTIPSSVTTIGEQAFGYTGVMWSSAPMSRIDGFTITGYSGTEAERYANDNGFKFISLGTTNEPEILGDVDGDSKVNIKDVTMIQRTAASIITLSDVQTKFADVNKDGKVNVNDATAIQKFVAGIDTGLEIGK